ncbi:MAG: hypothetical protein PVF68_01930 [Acidobacteriota bacterium]|jgi:hypothetical protein
MRTSCPECGSSLEVVELESDPGARQPCTGCGASVRPGLFRCPHCVVPLQVNRHLLPPGGGRGRCPACDEIVTVPALTDVAGGEVLPPAARHVAEPGTGEPEEFELPQGLRGEAMVAGESAPQSPFTTVAQPVATLAPEAPATAARVDAAAMGTAGEAFTDPVETTVTLATAELGLAGPLAEAPALGAAPPGEEPRESGVAADAAETSGAQEEAPATAPEIAPEATAPAPSQSIVSPEPQQPIAPSPAPRPTRPAPHPATPPAPRRGRSRSGAGAALLGLVLGGGLAAGGSYTVITQGLWEFPPFPLPQLGLGDLWGWTALTGTAGALVGMLLARLMRGRR